MLATGVVAGAWLACLELPVQLGDNCPASVRDAWWLKLYREATGRALTRTATPVTAIAEPQVEEDDLVQIAEPDLEDDDEEVLDPSLERERLDALEDAKKKAEAEAEAIKQRELDERAVKVVQRASEIVEAVQSVPEEAADDLVTRLARDLQGLSVEELSQRLAAAEAAQTKEASREAARAATARDEASRVYAKRTEDLVKAQRLKLLEEMGSLVQADAVDSDRIAAERRKALRAEKEGVLEAQRKDIDARWASEGQRAVEDAVGAVESGARALVDAARADAAQATGDAAVSRLMSLRELEVRVAAAHRAADAVPPDSDARILSEHAVVARGAAGSRAVGAVADDAVVAVALKARAEAPGVSTDVAALRARWVERVRPAARAAALEPQHAGPVARSALGGLFAALRLPGGRAPPGSPLAAVEACDAALEHGDVVGALAALEAAEGDLALSVRDWRRDAAASCVAAQTDRVLAARSGLVAAQRVE